MSAQRDERTSAHQHDRVSAREHERTSAEQQDGGSAQERRVRPLRVVAIADSDSYLKWAAGLLSTLPPGWARRVVLVRTPIAPSSAQREAAVAGLSSPGPVTERGLRRLLRELRRERPDVVLLACTGPVVQVLADALGRAGADRPVLVSGLPGLCLPASPRAWVFRSRVDLFVVHSRHERRDFTALGRELGATGEVVLATLPFLDPPPAVSDTADRVVFAAQAKVPEGVGERRDVLLALDRLAARHPQLRPVVKLRGWSGEHQTHREELPYDRLWNDLVAAGRVRRDAVEFAVGPMAEHLTAAAGLATVSSTAALEAMAAGVPVLVLGDFGIDERMLNLVFQDSGVVGDLDDLAAGRLRQPTPEWLRDNYFHDASECDWIEAVERLAELAQVEGLPPRAAVQGGPGPRRRRRNRLRLLVPTALLPLARRTGQLEERTRRTMRRALSGSVRHTA